MNNIQITNITPSELKEMIAEVLDEKLKNLPVNGEQRDPLITTQEACLIIGGYSKKTGGCSVTTFWELRKLHRLTERFIGNSPRFRKSEIIELAEKIAE